MAVLIVHLDLTPEQARLLNVSLNKISGTWDDELLARMLSELNTNPDLDLTSGFADDEVAKLLKSLERRDKREGVEGFELDAALEYAGAALRASVATCGRGRP